MRVRGKIIAGLVVAATLPALARPAAPAAPAALPIGDPDPADRQALVAVCGACHPVNLVTDNVRAYDDWRATVQTMVERGAKGSDEQFRRIDNYLYLTLTAIDVNEAAAEDLAAILGISDAGAAAIVTRRTSARFATIADLAKVAGVPPAALEARRARIGF